MPLGDSEFQTLLTNDIALLFGAFASLLAVTDDVSLCYSIYLHCGGYTCIDTVCCI